MSTARKHAEEQLANDAEELREKNAPLKEELAAAQERLFQDDDSAWPAWQRIPL